MTSFPSRPCCLDEACFAPQHQLRKQCPGCKCWIHAVCDCVLICDEGDFKEEDVICPQCDPNISFISLINKICSPSVIQQQQQNSPSNSLCNVEQPIFLPNEEQQVTPSNENQQVPLVNEQPKEKE